MLEYGCGGGYFTIWMAKRGAHVTAIERNPNAIRGVNFYAAKEGVADRVRVVEGDAEQDTIAGQYDFIFAKDLVEHLEDDSPFFRRLGTQLRRGGRTYLATQNDHSLNYLLEGSYERLYRGNAQWYGWDRTHRRFYNAPRLARPCSLLRQEVADRHLPIQLELELVLQREGPFAVHGRLDFQVPAQQVLRAVLAQIH